MCHTASSRSRGACNALVRRVARAARRRLPRRRRRGGDAARPQRRRPHQHAARDHGPDRRAQGLDQGQRAPRAIEPADARIARLGVGYCPEERGIFSSLSAEENLMLPPALGAGGMTRRADLRDVPEPEGARLEPGHAPVGRRAADARGRAHPAHRRAPAAARRDLRRPGAGHRAEARRDRPTLREQGYTIVMVEQNFRFAAPLADRFLVMEHGQVIQQFSPGRAAGAAWRACTSTSASDATASRSVHFTRRHRMKLKKLVPRLQRSPLAGDVRRLPPQAQISGDMIRIGFITDMSGLYADIDGPAGAEAIRMAIADIGGAVAGKKIEVLVGRPPEQARRRRRQGARVVRHARRRHADRRHQLRHQPGDGQGRAGEEEALHLGRRRRPRR